MVLWRAEGGQYYTLGAPRLSEGVVALVGEVVLLSLGTFFFYRLDLVDNLLEWFHRSTFERGSVGPAPARTGHQYPNNGTTLSTVRRDATRPAASASDSSLSGSAAILRSSRSSELLTGSPDGLERTMLADVDSSSKTVQISGRDITVPSGGRTR